MIKATWLINVYIDDAKTKLLFTKKYNSVKEITTDFKGLTRNFLYDFNRWKLNLKSRKQKSIEKYRRVEIIKSRKLKDGTIKTDIFKL